MPAIDKSHALDHVVVALFENRSLDNVLGHLYGPEDGKTPPTRRPTPPGHRRTLPPTPRGRSERGRLNMRRDCEDRTRVG
jgi:phospholipase C